MRTNGCFSVLNPFIASICPVRSGITSGCTAVLCASLLGSLFCKACCTSALRGAGAVTKEPGPLTFVSLFIVMLRGVCVSISPNFGDAPADASRCVPSLVAESRGFLCGDNGLLGSDDTVVDLDGVVTCLTGASPDGELRSGLAITLSARRNIRMNSSRAVLADHLSSGSIRSISGKTRKISFVVLSQRCCLRSFLCSSNTAVDNFPM